MSGITTLYMILQWIVSHKDPIIYIKDRSTLPLQQNANPWVIGLVMNSLNS